MTTAITAPTLLEDIDANTLHRRVSDYRTADYEPSGWNQESTNSDELVELHSPRIVTQRYLIRERTETTDRPARVRKYGEGGWTLFLIDFGEPETEFPMDHIEAIRFLRNNGRPVLAKRLISMLQSVKEDPDEAEVRIVSLRDMARLMVERQEFADPSIGSDDLGDVYAQWRIAGNGIMVLNFLGYGEVIITAQADETDERGKLDISNKGKAGSILLEYGSLVPSRN